VIERDRQRYAVRSGRSVVLEEYARSLEPGFQSNFAPLVRTIAVVVKCSPKSDRNNSFLPRPNCTFPSLLTVTGRRTFAYFPTSVYPDSFVSTYTRIAYSDALPYATPMRITLIVLMLLYNL